MFLSHQTYEGLLISSYSLVEATQFLLQNGLKFVLTEKFNQDVLEEYFGRHRALGRRNDNPTIYQFGYNQCRSSPMGRGGPGPPPPTFSFRKKIKKCNFFCNFHVIQKSLGELICLEILPKV